MEEQIIKLIQDTFYLGGFYALTNKGNIYRFKWEKDGKGKYTVPNWEKIKIKI